MSDNVEVEPEVEVRLRIKKRKLEDVSPVLKKQFSKPLENKPRKFMATQKYLLLSQH